VAEELRKVGVSCQIYEDTFEIVRSRKERALLGLSGIDYDIFDVRDMRESLQRLLEGQSVEVVQYSHKNGEPTTDRIVLSSAQVIILDGYAWQNGIFRHLLEPRDTVTISLLPRDSAVWRQNSILRDTTERGYRPSDAEKRFAELKATFLQNAQELSVDEVSNYFILSRADSSRPSGDRYLYVPGPRSKWPYVDLDQERRNNVFLAYQFADDDLVEGLRIYLRDKALTVLDGKLVDGRITKGILARIRQSHFFVGIVSKRDELKIGGFTSSSWILEEKGAAIMADCKIILMVEEGVDEHYVGFLQSDAQRIAYNVKNFSSKFPAVLYQLGSDGA
jgi:uridine kinase